jgi:hypothetical protein
VTPDERLLLAEVQTERLMLIGRNSGDPQSTPQQSGVIKRPKDGNRGAHLLTARTAWVPLGDSLLSAAPLQFILASGRSRVGRKTEQGERKLRLSRPGWRTEVANQRSLFGKADNFGYEPIWCCNALSNDPATGRSSFVSFHGESISQ